MPRLLSALALMLAIQTPSQALQPPPGDIETLAPQATTNESTGDYPINDSHFHLTNYIQRGVTAEQMLAIMGDRVNRVALFGIPLQQKWDHNISGYQPPTYYLHSDARLYYYSFTDAMIADEYLRLSPEQQARFDPMITGFNPTDGYAADHIERVLLMYPGVFAGIGEFSVHKEFVSSKVAGTAASLRNRALKQLLDFSGEAGLLVILHNDIDIPHPGEGRKPAYFEDMRALLRAHPETTIIWAHTGLGRVVKPTPSHLQLLESLLVDSDFAHVYFDISWDEVAKYVVANEAATTAWAQLLERYPDRFLFGTDSVAPKDQQAYLKTYVDYQPLWQALSPATRRLVTSGNYQRLFDAANDKVRRWERSRMNNSGTAAATAAIGVTVE